MTDNTPSSLICFKNGYSYVNIPVDLTLKNEEAEDTGVLECQVGPLPNFAVHGTVALAPHNPEMVKIFSLSQAAKKSNQTISFENRQRSFLRVDFGRKYWHGSKP